jgi:hypothetical protein
MHYLLERIEGFDPAEQVPAALTIARFALLLEQVSTARDMVERLAHLPTPDNFDRLQAQLLATHLGALDPAGAAPWAQGGPLAPHRVCILNVVADPSRFQSRNEQVRSCLQLLPGWGLEVLACTAESRHQRYRELAQRDDLEFVLILHEHVQPHQPALLARLAQALAECDIVSFAGARRWVRLDWRLDVFEEKSAAFMVACAERPNWVDQVWLGVRPGVIDSDMAVLDGSLLALRPAHLKTLHADADLLPAGRILEEAWTHEAHRAGLRLAVHRDLGLWVGAEPEIASDNPALGIARCALMDRYGFDPFEFTREDPMFLSVPTASPGLAMTTAAAFGSRVAEAH